MSGTHTSLGDESPAAWDEMGSLLSSQLAGVTAEVAAGRREAGELRAEHLLGHIPVASSCKQVPQKYPQE